MDAIQRRLRALGWTASTPSDGTKVVESANTDNTRKSPASGPSGAEAPLDSPRGSDKSILKINRMPAGDKYPPSCSAEAEEPICSLRYVTPPKPDTFPPGSSKVISSQKPLEFNEEEERHSWREPLLEAANNTTVEPKLGCKGVKARTQGDCERYD